MKNNCFYDMVRLSVLCVLLLFAARVSATAAPQTTQSISLHPGWNAVYLEVQPAPKDPATVFSGLPIESVWTWYGKTSPVQFIKDPSEGLMKQKGWVAWFSNTEENFLTNLFAIQANRAYLIKVSGTLPFTLSVSGTPRPASLTWTPDSFNFLGFHLDPSAAPSFASFFAPSKAHAGQAMYRLNDQGKWQFINNPAATVMRSGEAYWIYSEGGSHYNGSLAVEVGTEGLAFGSTGTESSLTIKNLSSSTKTVSLRTLSAITNVFSYSSYDEATKTVLWLPLESMSPLSVTAGAKATVTIAVRRENLSSSVEAILSVADAEGNRILVPVTVE